MWKKLTKGQKRGKNRTDVRKIVLDRELEGFQHVDELTFINGGMICSSNPQGAMSVLSMSVGENEFAYLVLPRKVLDGIVTC